MENAIQKDPTLDRICVHASPYSFPIYKKLGFNETGSLQEENGMDYTICDICQLLKTTNPNEYL